MEVATVHSLFGLRFTWSRGKIERSGGPGQFAGLGIQVFREAQSQSHSKKRGVRLATCGEDAG